MTNRLIDILIDSFPKIFIRGIIVTIPLTLIAFSLALIIATICAIIEYADVKIAKSIVSFYVWIIRGTPLLVQLYVVFFGLPRIGIMFEPFTCAVVVFALNEGAYCTETIRSALLSVPVGQMKAGLCVGMSFFETMRYVILPQSFKVAFPPLFNSLIGMVKDTSLAANITVMEMFMQTQRIVARVYEPLALYIEVAIIYLFFSTILTKVEHIGEKRLSLYESATYPLSS